MPRHITFNRKQDWETPQGLIDQLLDETLITIDVFATRDNAKAPLYITPEQDAFKTLWTEDFFCNAPYAMMKKVAPRWVELGCPTGIFLAPNATDTQWFHDFLRSAHIRFIDIFEGRLRFTGALGDGPPFPSMLLWGERRYLGPPSVRRRSAKDFKLIGPPYQRGQTHPYTSLVDAKTALYEHAEAPAQWHSRESTEAAAAIAPSAADLRKRVHDFLASRGPFGATDEEMQDSIPMAQNTQRPRRGELVKAGLVEKTGETRKTKAGRAAAVWRIA